MFHSKNMLFCNCTYDLQSVNENILKEKQFSSNIPKGFLDFLTKLLTEFPYQTFDWIPLSKFWLDFPTKIFPVWSISECQKNKGGMRLTGPKSWLWKIFSRRRRPTGWKGRLLEIFWPPQVADRPDFRNFLADEEPAFENVLAAAGGWLVRRDGFGNVFGRRRQLTVPKGSLLKMFWPPKAADGSKRTAFENFLSAEGSWPTRRAGFGIFFWQPKAANRPKGRL